MMTLPSKSRKIVLALALLAFLADRLSKWWVVAVMTLGESRPIVQNVFHLTYVQNSGAAFSLLHDQPVVLLSLTSAFFLILLVYSFLKPHLRALEQIAFGLILGGALGNIWDRVFIGRVIDYFDVTLINYPVFNLADSFIFVGVFLLFVDYARKQKTTATDLPR